MMVCWKQMRKHRFLVVFLTFFVVDLVLTMLEWARNHAYMKDREKKCFDFTVKRTKHLSRFYANMLDAKGRYFIESNVNGLASKPHRWCVTLATHCTLQSLTYLTAVASAWTCPISAAVYSDDAAYEEILLAFMSCNANALRNVSLHLVRPVASSAKQSTLASRFRLLDFGKDPVGSCRQLDHLLDREPSVTYPANLLRNVARVEARTRFVFSADVELIPGADLCASFQRFASKQFPACSLFSAASMDAMVLPAFEVKRDFFEKHRKFFPLDKKALRRLIEHGIARPMASDTCYSCQNRTDYQEWMRNLMTTDFSIAYEVDWAHSYEPLFVAEKRAVPEFDEGFSHRDFERLSRLCEMHVAGWRFYVLNSGFVLRRGFVRKTTTGLIEGKNFAENMALYLELQKRLARKYPGSSKNCDILPLYTL